MKNLLLAAALLLAEPVFACSCSHKKGFESSQYVFAGKVLAVEKAVDTLQSSQHWGYLYPISVDTLLKGSAKQQVTVFSGFEGPGTCGITLKAGKSYVFYCDASNLQPHLLVTNKCYHTEELIGNNIEVRHEATNPH